MSEAETEFLALVALGMFSADERGRIWRHKEWTKGSRTGSDPALVPLESSRLADVSGSGRRHHGSTKYRRVMFVSKGRRWKVAAHRVAWMLANGEPIPRGLEINHRNGNGEDNSPANLEIVTPSQNVTHAIRVLGAKRKARPGSTNPQSKIDETAAMKVRAMADARSMPQWKIAEMFGISQQTVANIRARKTWRHLPG